MIPHSAFPTYLKGIQQNEEVVSGQMLVHFCVSNTNLLRKNQL